MSDLFDITPEIHEKIIIKGGQMLLPENIKTLELHDVVLIDCLLSSYNSTIYFNNAEAHNCIMNGIKVANLTNSVISGCHID